MQMRKSLKDRNFLIGTDRPVIFTDYAIYIEVTTKISSFFLFKTIFDFKKFLGPYDLLIQI